MIVEPKVRGFICTTAHPAGCAQNVRDQVEYVKGQPAIEGGPRKVLVIGASTGYGLASRITAAFGGTAAHTLGVFFERAAAGKRTATAGWYNTVAFEKAADEVGLYAKSINGDAFSDEIKQKTIELIKNDWDGEVDLVVYSLASPRRIDPKTGETYSSVLKPIGHAFKNKTVDMNTGVVSDIAIEAASEEEMEQTVKVMGGEDWALWIDALMKAGVLADQVKTVAYSYVGPELTYPIYRSGTIGRAKEHLEKTAHDLDKKLKAKGGCAFISVNKALVTQASSAIPVVPLYISLLYKVMKAKGTHEGCIEQMYRLFHDFLYAKKGTTVDEAGRIRLDDWEMQQDVQHPVADLWKKVTTDTMDQLSDLKGCRKDFYKLFGFEVPGVSYAEEVDIECSIPSIKEVTAPE